MAVSVVSSWNLFIAVEAGPAASGASDNVLSLLTGFSGGMEYIWTLVLTVGGISSIVAAKFMQNSSIIGVWLLSSVMWTSYNKCIASININDWIPGSFLGLFTTALLFIWAAAIIGMMSNSG